MHLLTHLVHLTALVRMATADQCRRVFSVDGYILQRHVIGTASGTSFESCVIRCERHVHCYSINYITPSTCQLNNATAEKYPADFIAWPDAVYIGSLVRDERDSNPCDHRVPSCDGLCIVNPSSLSITCICVHSDWSACQADACKPQDLGMQTMAITDGQLLASSVHGDSSLGQARLGEVDGWTPNTDNLSQWFQVTFDQQTKIVTQVGTQGHSSKCWWVRKYRIKYKRKGDTSWNVILDPVTKQPKVFAGNTDRNTIVKTTLTPPIVADSIRIVPILWKGRIALRMELYGCGMVP